LDEMKKARARAHLVGLGGLGGLPLQVAVGD